MTTKTKAPADPLERSPIGEKLLAANGQLATLRERLAAIEARSHSLGQQVASTKVMAIVDAAARLVVGADSGPAADIAKVDRLRADLAQLEEDRAITKSAIKMQFEVIEGLQQAEADRIGSDVRPEYGKFVAAICRAFIELQKAIDAERRMAGRLWESGMLAGCDMIPPPCTLLGHVSASQSVGGAFILAARHAGHYTGAQPGPSDLYGEAEPAPGDN